MAINYTIAKHATAFPSKLLAQNGGKHIYNVTLSADTDNGCIIARGDFLDLDRYEDDGVVAGFTAKVVKQAANGNYYVEVVAPGNACLVYNVPIISEEWTNTFKKESNYYNAKDSEARAYELAVGDIFEVSKDAFSVPANVAVGKEIKAVTSRKMVITVA